MSVEEFPIQRLRLRYIKGEPVRYISHLDAMRLWERALRRARVPVAHTQGFNPRPRIALACPLPTGLTSRDEIVDVFLTEYWAPQQVLESVNAVLPAGVRVLQAQQVDVKSPALQSRVASVEYRANVDWPGRVDELEARLASLSEASELPRVRERKGKAKKYDLRPLIERVWLIGRQECGFIVGIRLRSGPGAAGRPDEVLDELEMTDYATGLERIAVDYHGGSF